MYAFEYHRPSTVAEAVSLLQGATDGRFLAGGHTLLPTLKQRLASPSDLIDLGGIKELKGILIDRGSQLRIGAMTPHAEVAGSADVRGWIPALAHLAEHIGDAQVRNRGTIGGSIANNDPAADYPAAIVGLNATVHTNQRTIAGRRLLHRHVRHRAQRRRDHHRSALPEAGQGGLRQVPQPGEPLRDRRGDGRADRRRRAGRGDRRGTVRVPAARFRERAGAQLLGRRASRA